MSFDKETVATYDQSAEGLAEYFSEYGARILDVEAAFELAGNPTAARVVEIGCGDGRDAVEIVKRATWYEGFDPSKGLLKLARQRNLDASFVEADAASYTYPVNLDMVFAFASLLHVDRYEMNAALAKVHASLREKGIVFLSLKERAKYTAETQHDQFGTRLFYFYDVATVLKAAGTGFEPVYEDHQLIGKTSWFTLALRKI